MCNYWHGATIECRGDGFMWDADYDGYDPDDKSMPCPSCNTRGYLEEARETAETVSYMSGWSGDMTGEDVWQGAIGVALRANPEGAPRTLRLIGIARPIIDHPENPADFIEKFYDHRSERYVVSRNKREGRYMARLQKGAQDND